MFVAGEAGNRRGIVQVQLLIADQTRRHRRPSVGVGLFILALAQASGQTLLDKSVPTASRMPTPEHGHATTLAIDPRCDLCREPGAPRWVFVIGTGRSGSTTALAMLNGVPGFYLAGEDKQRPVMLLREAWHARTFGGAAAAVASEVGARRLAQPVAAAARHDRTTMEERKKRESAKAGAAAPHGRALAHITPFYTLGFGTSGPSIYKPLERAGAAGLCDAQRVLKARLQLAAPPADARALGFKHVRDANREDLDFLAALFPCARFVFTFRSDLEAQVHSGYWRDFHDRGERLRYANERLRNETATLLAWGREPQHKKRVFEMELESVSLERYNALLVWLNVTDCRFTKLLAVYSMPGTSPQVENDGVCESRQLNGRWPISVGGDIGHAALSAEWGNAPVKRQVREHWHDANHVHHRAPRAAFR